MHSGKRSYFGSCCCILGAESKFGHTVRFWEELGHCIVAIRFMSVWGVDRILAHWMWSTINNARITLPIGVVMPCYKYQLDHAKTEAHNSVMNNLALGYYKLHTHNGKSFRHWKTLPHLVEQISVISLLECVTNHKITRYCSLGCDGGATEAKLSCECHHVHYDNRPCGGRWRQCMGWVGSLKAQNHSPTSHNRSFSPRHQSLSTLFPGMASPSPPPHPRCMLWCYPFPTLPPFQETPKLIIALHSLSCGWVTMATQTCTWHIAK